MDTATTSHTPPTPARELDAGGHLRLWLLRGALSLMLHASARLGPLDALLEHYPALRAQISAAATAGLEGLMLPDALDRLDRHLLAIHGPLGNPSPLPLNRLLAALRLDPESLSGFLLCAWIDEEPELGPMFDALCGHEGRPTRAMLSTCGGMENGVNALLESGYLIEEPLGGRRVLEVPTAVWQALQGRAIAPWRFTSWQALPDWERLILPPELEEAARAGAHRLPGEPVCWVLRGGPGSGRHTLAGALARDAGLGLIAPSRAQPPSPTADDTASHAMLVPALATLLGAMPVLALEPMPGQRLILPEWPGFHHSVAVCLPRHGGLAVEGYRMRWLDLGMPDAQERARHWCRALGRAQVEPELTGLRLPRGSIHRLAASVAPGGIDTPSVAMRELEARGRYLLDGVARRVPAVGPGEALAMSEELQEEFDALIARCRHREALGQLLPGSFGQGAGAGVRALFKGPSGTGKTLAARHLADALTRPLYRVDLASVVSKYIGETERNLERVFEAAESLDIVLLLDEGDALMAGRTDVSNANDRYANLETNYLLQRLETYEGILIITTNAADRIDTAFSRRMDLTLDFALPDALMRHRLWQWHLPARHRVGDEALEEIAVRCCLSGGQIRNAALHAALLCVDAGEDALGSVGASELLAALRLEYRRAGQHCPSLALS
ncbi:ATP-binding protein [Caballeronia novacaledonica]|uniref:ATP-binding protein n=1 Tax=Caballeronia novacaledonica TaxID=1544861 RepID=UPI001EE3029A|nr:AAA family ATPase [Caballeronia novacaledonica]GJH13036.1 ATP-binding protein [Caballeronia novacaledonica]